MPILEVLTASAPHEQICRYDSLSADREEDMRITNVVVSLFITVFLAFAVWPSDRAAAQTGIEPGPGKGWLTIASRTQPQDAISYAQRYASQFPTAVVFASSNGYFAVSLGWADTRAGQPLLQSLISSGTVPADSYFTAGQRFVRAIWSANNSQTYRLGAFLAATRIGANQNSRQVTQEPEGPSVNIFAAREGVVANLKASGDNFLSLRSGPGSSNREIARMQSDTPLTVTGESKGWYQVSLSNGMRGWAFGKYVEFRDVPVIGPEKEAISEQASNPEIPVIGPEKDTAENQESQETASLEDEQASTQTQEPTVPIADQRRVALVLGNSEYENTTVLPNPKNDADAMSSKLTALGFEVVTGLDGTKADMERAVREFVRRLPDADVALFFYAGHAMQVDGRNYLIPIDAKLEDSTAIDFETIDLGVILNFMNSGNRISVALLDACRDNPLSRQFARNFQASRSAFIGRGLAAPATGSGEMLIGFATAPGEIALDGEGNNSPFTTALLKHIDSQGVDIEIMLKRVRNEVFQITNQAQEPWVNSALRREFQFNPG